MVDKEYSGELKFGRYFTKDLPQGKDVYDLFKWEKSDVDITDENGELLFVQKDVEFPSHWSSLARKIAASRYFFGDQERGERENSVRSLIGRVSETFKDWAVKQNYFSSDEEACAFRDEIAYLALSQKMAFNSPVWFNVGVHKLPGEVKKEQKESYVIDEGSVILLPPGKEKEYPQTSACFIQSIL